MVGNSVPECLYSHQLIENSPLPQWLVFIRENSQNTFAAFRERVLGEKVSPKTE